MKKLIYPCETCVHQQTCDAVKGCFHWRGWFREYWRRLRAAYLGEAPPC